MALPVAALIWKLAREHAILKRKTRGPHSAPRARWFRWKRSTPLAASRHYYPGFFAVVFLVLLRLAIGWHFLTEGREKVEALLKGKPFTAEPFLRASTGPFAPIFEG